MLFQLRKRTGTLPPTLPFVDGLTVACDPRFGSVSNLVYFGPYFEYDELRFCKRFLRPGDSVIDGGANIGLVSLLFSRWVGEQGHVLSFEPAPEAAAQLRHNLELNAIGNVELIEAALSDGNEQADLIADMDVSNQLLRGDAAGHAVARVATRRLDDDAGANETFELAKLDLEGAELQALEGARALLGSGRLEVILLEAATHQLARLGDTREALLEMLGRHSYQFAHYDSDSNDLRQVKRPAEGSFLAIHSSHSAKLAARLA